MAGTKFAPGHTVKLGKPSPGSGRTPDWLKERCREIVDKAQLIEFLGDIVQGKDVEQAVGDQGETIRIPPAVRDRLKAAEMLLDRAYGKPGQPIDLTTPPSELDAVPTRDLLEVFAAFSGGTTGEIAPRTGAQA